MNRDPRHIREVVSRVVEEKLATLGEITSSRPVSGFRRFDDTPNYRSRELITETDVAKAAQDGRSLVVRPGALLTPAAKDALTRFGVELVEDAGPGISAPQGLDLKTANMPAKPEASVAQKAAPSTPAPTAPAAKDCTKGFIAVAADHGGFEMKQQLIRFLEDEAKIPCMDLGTHSTDPVDYPDFARLVAEAVAAGRSCRGLIVDGAGIGSSIAANKIKGIRAAHCSSPVEAKNAREHNDANVLCLGGRMIGIEIAKAISIVFMKTDFAGGRHQNRVDKITGMER